MVKHVLKDGSKIDDVTGYVVKKEYASSAYNLISAINTDPRRVRKRGGNNVEKSI